jgi:hypothetical protein
MMDETITTVATWADETFGTTTPEAALQRALLEIKELQAYISWLGNAQDKGIAEEAADVCITLYRYIYLVDPEAINKKMAVNRKRKWKLNGDGTAQHVKSQEERAAELMNHLPEFKGKGGVPENGHAKESG